jgi:hypothetical protein
VTTEQIEKQPSGAPGHLHAADVGSGPNVDIAFQLVAIANRNKHFGVRISWRQCPMAGNKSPLVRIRAV